MSVPRMAMATRASGVRARRPPSSDGQARAGIRVGDGVEAADQPHAAELVDVDAVVGVRQGVATDLDRGREQDRAEEQEGPREAGDHLRAEGDEDAAEHERAADADEQHPLAQLTRDGEGREQDDEDEEVVDRERLLDEVAGVVLDPLLGAVLPPEPATEGHGDGDVDGRPADRLAHARVVRAAGDEEVDDEERGDAGEGRDPQRRRADRLGAPCGGAGVAADRAVSMGLLRT